jgi:hypothetical protein
VREFLIIDAFTVSAQNERIFLVKVRSEPRVHV